MRCVFHRGLSRGPRSARPNELTSLSSHAAPEKWRSWLTTGLHDEARLALWKAAVTVFAPQALTYTGLFARRLLMHKVSGARRIEHRWVFIPRNQRDCLPRGLTFEVSGPQRRGAWAVWTRINHTATRPRCHAVAGPLDRGVRRHLGRRVATSPPHSVLMRSSTKTPL